MARSGGRFNPPDQHRALIWILFHVLREYARHVTSTWCALADGTTGE